MPTTNADLWEAAQRVIAGGVNSPVRAFRAVGGAPVFIASGRGARVRSVEGREYLDYVQSWGAMILGHAHPRVVEAVRAAAEKGTSFGMPTPGETELAERLVAAVPTMRRVRLVNSGTEACMSALRLARGFTGRDKVVKFAGGYHGHSDYLLVAAGSGGATFGVPDSAGVPRAFAEHTLVLPYNDADAARAAFARHGGEIAAVIVEPVAANMGVVPPAEGFLPTLRELCTAHGALLIFDEVITGFRLRFGGAQALFGVEPDLTCLGKVIGGGLPIGAYGGREEVMERLAPAGPVYQAGTLSGNPIAVAAGLATLRALEEDPPYVRMDALAKALADGLAAALRAEGVPGVVNRAGSLLTVFFGIGRARTWDDVQRASRAAYAAFFRGMLDRRILLPPSPFEAWFLGAAHGDDDIQRTLLAAEGAVSSLP